MSEEKFAVRDGSAFWWIIAIGFALMVAAASAFADPVFPSAGGEAVIVCKSHQYMRPPGPEGYMCIQAGMGDPITMQEFVRRAGYTKIKRVGIDATDSGLWLYIEVSK